MFLNYNCMDTVLPKKILVALTEGDSIKSWWAEMLECSCEDLLVLLAAGIDAKDDL